MSSIASRLRSLASYALEMRTPADLLRYAQLRAMYHVGRGDGPPRALALRSLGGASVLCRASRDVWTLKHTFLEGYHLPPVTLPESPTIVDLGCNVGYTVAHFAHLYPRARLVGVEMDRANFELARRNTAQFGARVRLLHAAAWNADGEVNYDGTEVDAYCITAEPNSEGTRRVRALRLMSILRECDLAWVDYLKMDIEGAEAAVLADASEWAGCVGALKVEVHPPATLAACRRLLTGYGFQCQTDSHHPNCLAAHRHRM